MTEDQVNLCRYGSITAAAPHIGEDRAVLALSQLTEMSPMDIRGVWETVIAYWKLQIAYETALDNEDAATQLKVIAAQEALIQRLY